MKLLKQLFKNLRSADAKAADAMKNPIDDGKLAIEDSKKQIVGFRKAIAQALANNKVLEREVETAKQTSEKYLNIAKQAKAAGNMDDARAALTEKQTADQRVESLSAEITKNSNLIASQRKQLDIADSKIAKAENNLKTQSLRLEGAKIRKGLAEATSNFNTGDNPLAALDELENAVNTAECEADAVEELSTSSVDSLENKYSSASANKSIDDELEKL